MSILIKDMVMPQNCCECPVNINICNRGYRYLLEHPELYDKRANDCPLVELTMSLDAFITFVKNTLDNPNPEPFCPFTFSGYCNDAYSNRCYQCEHAVKDYLKVDDGA